jgi:lysophospholipase-2
MTSSLNFKDEEDAPSRGTTIIEPTGCSHTHTVIFLHGREDYGEDLAQYFFDSKSSDGQSLAEIFPSVKWVFPTAKLRYSAQRDFEFSTSSFAEALKGEEIITQWFDVWDIMSPTKKKELMIPGLKESIQQIIDIIKEESESVPLEKIVLGRISQGCATAIYTLLSSGMSLGGFIGLSSWLPFQDGIASIPSGSGPASISRQFEANFREHHIEVLENDRKEEKSAGTPTPNPETTMSKPLKDL